MSASAVAATLHTSRTRRSFTMAAPPATTTTTTASTAGQVTPAAGAAPPYLTWINVVAFLVNVVVVFGRGVMGLGGLSTNATVLAKYPSLITPASWASVIWIPIFLGQLLWVLRQLLITSERSCPGVLAVGYGYFWIAAFQVGWTVSLALEIIWLSLVFVVLLLQVLDRTVQSLRRRVTKTWKAYLLWQWPFSLYCGWIYAAAAVNIDLLVVKYVPAGTALPIDQAMELAVSGTMIALLLFSAATYLIRYPVDFVIPCVIAYSFLGIYVQLARPPAPIVGRFTTQQIDSFRTFGILIAMVAVVVATVIRLVYSMNTVQRPAAIRQQEARATARKRAVAAPTRGRPQSTDGDDDDELGDAEKGDAMRNAYSRPEEDCTSGSTTENSEH